MKIVVIMISLLAASVLLLPKFVRFSSGTCGSPANITGRNPTIGINSELIETVKFRLEQTRSSVGLPLNRVDGGAHEEESHHLGFAALAVPAVEQ